jgi:hypothetical protein
MEIPDVNNKNCKKTGKTGRAGCSRCLQGIFIVVTVRYCQIKTTPCVERKDLLIQTTGPSLFLGSE